MSSKRARNSQFITRSYFDRRIKAELAPIKAHLNVVDKRLDRLEAGFIVMREDIKELKQRMCRLEAMFEEGFSKLDKFLHRLTKQEEENIIQKYVNDQAAKRMDGFDQRLGKVEQTMAA